MPAAAPAGVFVSERFDPLSLRAAEALARLKSAGDKLDATMRETIFQRGEEKAVIEDLIDAKLCIYQKGQEPLIHNEGREARRPMRT